MKILVVSSYLPYPLHSGGHIRLYNLLKRLNKNYEITLVCEKRDYQVKKDEDEVRKICNKLITVSRKKQWSISNVLKSGLSANSFLVEGHRLSEMKKKISQILNSESFDLIHCETFYVASNVPSSDTPLVVAEHNIEYLVYKRYADNASKFLKPLLGFDILKIKQNEENVWRRARAVLVVSGVDKEIIEKVNDNAFLIPNGVDINEFSFKKKLNVSDTKTILYIGDFKWIQNIDAATLILKKIWPELRRRFDKKKINLKLWIVGKNIPKSFKNLKKDGVVFDENAPNKTSEIFSKSHILLAPIRVGGGTSYKILEAMASGVPVVTTSLGVIGLGAIHENQAHVANTEDEMIKGIEKLLNDEKYYSLISASARKLIEEKFDWEKIAGKLEEVYLKTI